MAEGTPADSLEVPEIYPTINLSKLELTLGSEPPEKPRRILQ